MQIGLGVLLLVMAIIGYSAFLRRHRRDGTWREPWPMSPARKHGQALPVEGVGRATQPLSRTSWRPTGDVTQADVRPPDPVHQHRPLMVRRPRDNCRGRRVGRSSR
jgi:hypothetical protein